jgi:hypothetical protein
MRESWFTRAKTIRWTVALILTIAAAGFMTAIYLGQFAQSEDMDRAHERINGIERRLDRIEFMSHDARKSQSRMERRLERILEAIK